MQQLTIIVAVLVALTVAVEATDGPQRPPPVYYVSGNQLNWYQANNECRRLGLRLAVVESAEAQALLVKAITDQNLQSKRFWIGANNLHAPGTRDYRWNATGKLATYFNFKSNQPDNLGTENCLQTWTKQKWNDAGCNTLANYACEDTCCEC